MRTPPSSSYDSMSDMDASPQRPRHRRRRRRLSCRWTWWGPNTSLFSTDSAAPSDSWNCIAERRRHGGGGKVVVASVQKDMRRGTHSPLAFCCRVQSIPVVFVFIIFTSMYVVTMRCTIQRWLPLDSSGTHTLLFSICTACSVILYIIALATDPGRVPPTWTPSETATLSERKKSGAHRWCKKCHAFKPPRTHHCRRCGRCVLKMDHHCSWLNTCIGYRNYARFIFFLASTTIALLYVVVSVATHLRRVAASVSEARRSLPPHRFEPGRLSSELQNDPFRLTERLAHAGTTRQCVLSELGIGTLSFSLAVAIGGLLMYHLYLISRNMTTIEYYEGTRAVPTQSHTGMKHSSPNSTTSMNVKGNTASVTAGSGHVYDIGVMRNFREALCPDVTSGGTTFPISPRAHASFATTNGFASLNV